MKQKRNKMWKSMFSRLLVMAMLITAIPVTAFAEPETRAVRVWFEYDNGNTQNLDENGEFHLTTEDKGTFKAEGYSSSRVGWMVVKFINKWTKEWWADYNSGVFQPKNEELSVDAWLEDFDTQQKLVEFKVTVEKAASIVEVKALSGDREISMEHPCQMNGSEAQTLTLKVRKDNSGEFESLALSNFDIEKVSGWMVVKFINKWTKEWWADYNSGVFQPKNEEISLDAWLEDFDTEQKLVEFKVNVEKAASIVEVKAFSGDREISMEDPCQMNGSEAQTLTLKVRKDNSGEFESLALSNFDIEKVSGEGMILPADGTFRVDGQEAVFKATLKSDPSIFVEFKAVSKDVALQAISVSVPQVWYIDSWNGLADYYVGIQKGDNP